MTTVTSVGSGLPLLDFSNKPNPLAAALMLLGGAVGSVSFAIVLYMLVTEGHASFNTSSDVAWGAPIAYYLFFLLASSGLAIIASLDTVFGVKVFYPVAKRCVFLAIITMITGFTLLALELGHPFRMVWAMPTGLQVKSPMWWMGTFYTIDLILLCAKFYLMHTGEWESKRAHGFSVGSFVVGICAAGTLGLVFGMMAMRPAWYSPVMPVYFILTGFATAGAFMLLLGSLTPRTAMSADVRYLNDVVLPRLFFVALLAVIGMRFGQIITGLWSNFEGMEAHWRAIGHPMFNVEIWIGFLLPLVLMSKVSWRADAKIQLVAAVAFMVGIFAARLELLIVGQEVPLFKGHWTGFVDYWPSFTEWMLVPAGMGMFLFLYGAGDWVLRLQDARVPQES